ncbi:flavin reductase family protein [Tsukamurella sp. NPDC003166]|uniref:flavin reductase family protein n=1 Tax=Tsukamurella sp. NPDC003166 TaxID=3154444 RepID=UPI0033A071CB
MTSLRDDHSSLPLRSSGNRFLTVRSVRTGSTSSDLSRSGLPLGRPTSARQPRDRPAPDPTTRPDPSAFGCFPSGVTALCGIAGGAPVGIAASSFTSVSISPPLVSVCFQTSSTTWPRLRELDRVGISALAESHNDVCLSLSRRSDDRFVEVAWDSAESGAVFVEDAPAWLECSLYTEMSAGDHSVALFEIYALHADPEAAPLIFHASRFRRLATA